MARFLLHLNWCDRLDVAWQVIVVSWRVSGTDPHQSTLHGNGKKYSNMRKSQHVHVAPDVRMVAKISLSVAVASFLGLLLVLILVSDDKARGYRQSISAFVLTREHLDSAMLVFGLALISFAGSIAWLFSIYASFRIAGPLYRISRNLELLIDDGLAAPQPIRHTDSLQQEWREFEASSQDLRAQHDKLRQALGEVEKALAPNSETEGSTDLATGIARLKKVEQLVHL